MTTTAYTDITPAYIQINAENPQMLSEFYTESIGLTLLEEETTTSTYRLGTSDNTLLIEIQKAQETPSQKTAGLYHLALLVPKRSDLGEILRSLIINKVPMQGASDHGYSEALYLQDPEGNGIEIYWDKPMTEWNILANGEIPGVTLPMDAEGVIASAEKEFDHLPNGTKMGHYHISIPNLEEADKFYSENLGLGNRHTIPDNAVFLASGQYHHHLGVNVWFGKFFEQRQPGQKGLGILAWNANQSDMDYIIEQLTTNKIDFKKEDEAIIVSDPFGITHKIIRNK